MEKIEIQSLKKKYLLSRLECLIDNNEKNEVERNKLLSQILENDFSGAWNPNEKENFEKAFEVDFVKMSLNIKQHMNIDIKELTVLEYLGLMDVIKESNKNGNN
jgi:phage tail tube protein FII